MLARQLSSKLVPLAPPEEQGLAASLAACLAALLAALSAACFQGLPRLPLLLI